MFKTHIIDPILKAISEYPDRPAFCISNEFYSYGDFSKQISSIQQFLGSTEIEEKNVGLVANDDIETYAAIIALWLEGFAYVPLHPNQPKDRLHEIIIEADISCVLDSTGQNTFDRVINIDTSKLSISDSELTFKVVDDNDLAYILFTSGSTGKPKGVPIMRSNIASFLKSFMEVGFEITEKDRCLQCFDLTFDVSIQSYLVPLSHGACTYTIPHDQIKWSYVYGLLDDEEITFSVMAPSMIRYLRPYFDELNFEHLKYSILTAEASTLELLEEWSKCCPNAIVYDFYGPTEATIYCTYSKLNKNSKNKEVNGLVTIGKALNGLNAVTIDKDQNILKNSDKGELCISGPQITPGYWKNEEKNTEAFIYLRFNDQNLRFYRTGDSCYIDEDGDIMYSGRIDYQVKIQGYRIELGEIEFHSRKFLDGDNAIATTFANQSGIDELALFVEREQFDELALKSFLKSKMPHYMIPSRYIPYPSFPINTNGKIDRIALNKEIKNG